VVLALVVRWVKAVQAEDALANSAEELAEEAANRLLAELRPAVASAKAYAMEPITALRQHATEVAEFMQVLQETAGDLLRFVQQKIADFGQRLGRCESVEDFVNLILHEVSALIGSDQELSVASIRGEWTALGTFLTAARTWAVRVRAEAEREADAAAPAPQASLPAGDDDEGDGDL